MPAANVVHQRLDLGLPASELVGDLGQLLEPFLRWSGESIHLRP
jgi:hypothetical protein